MRPWGCKMQIDQPLSDCSDENAKLSCLSLRIASTAADDTSQSHTLARFSLTATPALSTKVTNRAAKHAPSAAQDTGPISGSVSQPHEQQSIPGGQLDCIGDHSAVACGHSGVVPAAPSADVPHALLSAFAAMLTAAERDSDPDLAVIFHHRLLPV